MTLSKVSIITGFLGVGKTTLIKQLLSVRPANENWAIIVNEFGQVGVDALLLTDSNVLVKQVPGGCACCAAQLPFQLALNQLLKGHHLDRILIEPSGLGHADKLKEILSQSQYDNWLKLTSVITLIDPNQFNQTKYCEHEIYKRQLLVANCLYISKQSLSDKEKILKVQSYAQSNGLTCLHDHLDPLNVLQEIDGLKLGKQKAYPDPSLKYNKFIEKRKIINNKDKTGFNSFSLTPNDADVFNLDKLVDFISKHNFTRVKGVVDTDQGVKSINAAESQLSIENFNQNPAGMIIEIIYDETLSETYIKAELTQCISKTRHIRGEA